MTEFQWFQSLNHIVALLDLNSDFKFSLDFQNVATVRMGKQFIKITL